MTAAEEKRLVSQVQDGFDKGAALEKHNFSSIDLIVGRKHSRDKKKWTKY